MRGQRKQKMTNELLQQFEEEMKMRNLGAHTQRAYARGVRVLLVWLTERNITSLNEVTAHQLHQWRMTLKSSALAPASQKVRVAAVKAFFAWLARIGVARRNPAASLRIPKKRHAREARARMVPAHEVADKLETIHVQSFRGVRGAEQLRLFP